MQETFSDRMRQVADNIQECYGSLPSLLSPLVPELKARLKLDDGGDIDTSSEPESDYELDPEPDVYTAQTISAAAVKVFSTYELLEQILLYVDDSTLITSGRLVSKAWCQILATSQILRWKTWRWEENYLPRLVLRDYDFYVVPPVTSDSESDSPASSGDEGNPFVFRTPKKSRKQKQKQPIDIHKPQAPWTGRFEFAHPFVDGIQNLWNNLTKTIPDSHWGTPKFASAIRESPMMTSIPAVELIRPRSYKGVIVQITHIPWRKMTQIGKVHRKGNMFKLRDLVDVILDHTLLGDKLPLQVIRDGTGMILVTVWVIRGDGKEEMVTGFEVNRHQRWFLAQ